MNNQSTRRRRSNSDHVVLQGDQFVCLHCGDSYRPNLPCPINVMAAAMKAYVNDHRHCSLKQDPQPAGNGVNPDLEETA